MSEIEFIFLILGSICLIDFILESILIYENKELAALCGLKTETIIKRYIEILIIIITISIFAYKFLTMWGVSMSEKETDSEFLKRIFYYESGRRVCLITLDNGCGLNERGDCDRLIDIVETLVLENKELENALIDMVNQFAYDEKRKNFEDERLYTGGLSALENAFDVLDIDEGIRRKDLWKKI